MPWTESMTKFMASHTSQEEFLLGRNKNMIKNEIFLFSTQVKNSLDNSETALAWRKQMSPEKVREVEKACEKPFSVGPTYI